VKNRTTATTIEFQEKKYELTWETYTFIFPVSSELSGGKQNRIMGNYG
jgi:hypothetical protein